MRNLIHSLLLVVLSYFAAGCQSSASTSLNISPTSEKPTPTPTSAVVFNGETNNRTNVTSADVRTLLSGKWKQEDADDCYCNQCLNIQFDALDENFCVESNQIWISVFYQLDEKNREVKIYFKEPTDLGRGGLGLEWKKFDRQKPIAIIDISKVEKNEISLKWLGFTYKKSNRREFRYGSQYEGTYQKQQ